MRFLLGGERRALLRSRVESRVTTSPAWSCRRVWAHSRETREASLGTAETSTRRRSGRGDILLGSAVPPPTSLAEGWEDGDIVHSVVPPREWSIGGCEWTERGTRADGVSRRWLEVEEKEDIVTGLIDDPSVPPAAAGTPPREAGGSRRSVAPS